MLNAKTPWPLHFVQNVLLILLSLSFLPLDAYILLSTYVLQILLPGDNAGGRCRKHLARLQPKTILVTGVGSSGGLALARLFHQSGHKVIGADIEQHGVPVCGRFSRALDRFYGLPEPSTEEGAASYIQALLKTIHRENIDLWVSFSAVASAADDSQAKEVIERRLDCKCIQLDVETTAMLQEKDRFIRHTESLGLPVPETHDVTSRAAVHHVLSASARHPRKKRYIMKSVRVEDAVRGDVTLLPHRTLSETYNYIARISISRSRPWVLQQFIRGDKFCTHALVVNGSVRLFVACPSSGSLMHYEALPESSALSRAMLRFTEEFVARSGKHWTGHLSFDFLVEERESEKGSEKRLFPIECNPRPRTAVVLFGGMGPEVSEAYMSLWNGDRDATNGAIFAANAPADDEAVMSKAPSPKRPARYYWVGHDLVELVFYPLLLFLGFRVGLRQFLDGCCTFLQHLLLWKDGTFEVWDPLPWWWLYHVYWPGQFLIAVLQKRKWTRVDVSTSKMFAC
jgi:hypothetical protein